MSYKRFLSARNWISLRKMWRRSEQKMGQSTSRRQDLQQSSQIGGPYLCTFWSMERADFFVSSRNLQLVHFEFEAGKNPVMSRVASPQTAVWVNFFFWLIIGGLVVVQRRKNSGAMLVPTPAGALFGEPGATAAETEPFFNRPPRPQWGGRNAATGGKTGEVSYFRMICTSGLSVIST